MNTTPVLLLTVFVCLVGKTNAQQLGALVDEVHGKHYSAWLDGEAAKRVQLELPDHSTEGGAAVGYFRESGDLIFIDVWLMGEMGRSEYSFCPQGQRNFTVVERQFKYNRPFYLTRAEADRVGDTEFFDPGKTIVAERFAFIREGKGAYVECDAAVDPGCFRSPADLAAMLDTVQKRLMELKSGPSAVPLGEDHVPVELIMPASPTRIDTALAGVGLNDAGSAAKMLGTMKDRGLVENSRYPIPHASYSDMAGETYATFGLHYGAGLDQFAEMELSRAEPDTLFGKLDQEVIKSGLGIELGMSREQVRMTLGDARMVGRWENGHMLWRYRVEDPAGNGLLRGYGLPIYYITAEFDATGLIEYRFGFEYP